MKHGRLIDAEKLKAHYAWWANGSEEHKLFKNLIDQIVDLQPTVHEASELRKGDMIKCADKDDLIHTDRDLSDAGYVTEFCFEKDGERGNWVVINGRAYDD